MYKKQESIFKLFSKINKQEVENKCKVEPVSITLIKNSKHIALYIMQSGTSFYNLDQKFKTYCTLYKGLTVL